MEKDKKIETLEQLLKSEEYKKDLREFQNMVDNLDNNWKNKIWGVYFLFFIYTCFFNETITNKLLNRKFYKLNLLNKC